MQYFYYETIKRITAIFASLFDEVTYKSDKGVFHKVPIFFAPRERFLTIKIDDGDLYRLGVAQSLPRMAFEMIGINYAPERATNRHQRISNTDDNKWQWNRHPYDFSFNLYIATKKFETSTQIVEQIVPLFTPSFNITVDEMSELNLKNDIAIVLNSLQHELDHQGSLSDDQRVVVWTLQFTVKGWLYNNTNTQKRITETITRLAPSEIDRLYSDVTAYVNPIGLEDKTQPHTIEEHRQPRTDIFGDEP